MADYQLTDQQVEILDLYQQRWNFVVMAGAGAGKTSTLAAAARTRNVPGLYLAYNKAIVQDAGGAFPDTISCRTAHSLAFRFIGHQYAAALKEGALRGWQIAKALHVRRWSHGPHKLSAPTVATLARRTVKRWAGSTDLEIQSWHVPVPDSITNKDARADLRATVLNHARRLWYVCVNPEQTIFRFDHDWYLKLFSMAGPNGTVPQLPVDTIFFDECQDADPVIRLIFEQQANCQLLAVGDPEQAIYAWRGAEDAITRFMEAGAPMRPLTTSWRFGQVIADEANRWLEALDGQLRLSGNPAMESRLGMFDHDEPHTVLCRTNAGVMEAVVNAVAAGVRVSMVGCDKEVIALANSCERLIDGREVDHPELVGFDDWNALATFVESDDCDNPTLRTLVRLTSTYTMADISKALRSCSDEKSARIVVSTAHKSKGRQWRRVRVGSDFAASSIKGVGSSEQKGPTKADLRLGYVTVTRAREVLDCSNMGTLEQFDLFR